MSIAPPASDSVTNRRELEFSNQILKTKQDGTDRRAERQCTSKAAGHPTADLMEQQAITGERWN